MRIDPGRLLGEQRRVPHGVALDRLIDLIEMGLHPRVEAWLIKELAELLDLSGAPVSSSVEYVGDAVAGVVRGGVRWRALAYHEIADDKVIAQRLRRRGVNPQRDFRILFSEQRLKVKR